MGIIFNFCKSDRGKKILCGVRYAISVLLMILAATNAGAEMLLVWVPELAILICLTQIIAGIDLKNKWGKNLCRVFLFVSGLLLVLYNIQMMVMFFGSSFVTHTMLTNMAAVKDLSGKAGPYTAGVLLVVISALLPMVCFRKKAAQKLLYGSLAVEMVTVLIIGCNVSPCLGYVQLCQTAKNSMEISKRMSTAEVNAADFKNEKNTVAAAVEAENLQAVAIEGEENGTSPVTAVELSSTDAMMISDNRLVSMDDKKSDVVKPSYDGSLGEQPNIILLITEGYSQDVIEHPKQVSPNIAAFEEKSLFFTNYYNHTFATYRGVIGQLFSGHQFNDMDVNHLISLQSIMADRGYTTTFINVEPKKEDWTQYVHNLGFQNVVGDDITDLKGMTDTLSDKQAYELLYDTVEKQNETGKPSLTVMYTFGTHLSLDSPDKKFGDGKDPVRNRCYNLDYQFGKFMKKYEKSDLAKNTIVVFTTDHASYVDNSYRSAFPGKKRKSRVCSRVPFFIYYPGIRPQTVDVKGRNSLDMTPTVLDYLNISADNYFLGCSLLSPEKNDFDVVFDDPDEEWWTAGGQLTELDKSESAIQQKIFDYYALANKGITE
uniref:LTA synthase family protein n=1 Tax=Eubacterium cellulosolvens TaxID=29322 RepID=UPI0006860B9C|nr:sulfatase-like hydrolase/transferase [[Eubacterium] cellulosolvens]